MMSRTREIGGPDDLGKLPPAIVIANRAVQRLIGTNIHFGLDAVQRRQAGLRVEVYRKHPIALQRKILREVRGGRRLPATTFKI